MLACGERAFLSHDTAASVWGLLRSDPPWSTSSVVGKVSRIADGNPRAPRQARSPGASVRRAAGPRGSSSPARAVLDISATRDRQGARPARSMRVSRTGASRRGTARRCSRATGRAAARLGWPRSWSTRTRPRLTPVRAREGPAPPDPRRRAAHAGDERPVRTLRARLLLAPRGAGRSSSTATTSTAARTSFERDREKDLSVGPLARAAALHAASTCSSGRGWYSP